MAEQPQPGASELGAPPAEIVAAELAGRIRSEAQLAAMHGKFSPLIRVRDERDQLTPLSPKADARRVAELVNLARQGFPNVGLDDLIKHSSGWLDAGIFGTEASQYQSAVAGWSSGRSLDHVLWRDTPMLISWRGQPHREHADYVELSPTADPGVARLLFSFVVSPETALDLRKSDLTFAAFVPTALAQDVLAAVRQHPDILLPLIHRLYPGTGEPMPPAIARSPTRIDLARASTINRREEVKSIQLSDYTTGPSPHIEIIQATPSAPALAVVAEDTISGSREGARAESRSTQDREANANAVVSALDVLVAKPEKPDREQAYRQLIAMLPQLDPKARQALYQLWSLPGIVVRTNADAIAVLKRRAEIEGIKL